MSLKLLSSDALSSWITDSHWLKLSNDRIIPNKLVECYEIAFANDGNAAAAFAGGLLTDFVPERIGSGIIWIYQIFPPEEAQIRVIHQTLHLYGYEKVSTQDFRFHFQQDYGGLLSCLSWCLACGWGFYFLAESRQIFFRGSNENILDICWARDEKMKDNIDSLLANLSAKRSRGHK
ncbi:MAG: hypothetical protein ABSB42_08230 [Tepidisphaeraceae bacterium]|jgi:hypothetical protein